MLSNTLLFFAHRIVTPPMNLLKSTGLDELICQFNNWTRGDGWHRCTADVTCPTKPAVLIPSQSCIALHLHLLHLGLGVPGTCALVTMTDVTSCYWMEVFILFVRINSQWRVTSKAIIEAVASSIMAFVLVDFAITLALYDDVVTGIDFILSASVSMPYHPSEFLMPSCLSNRRPA